MFTTKNSPVGSNDPVDYNSHSLPQEKTAMVLLQRNLVYVKTSDVVIDLGCGTGKISEIISRSVKKVHAFDISASAVAYAKLNYPHIIFVEADAADFTYQSLGLSQPADWIFAANSLHWLKTPEQLRALNCMRKALKENGRLLITLGLRHDLWDVVDRLILMPEWQVHFKDFENPRAFYTKEQYQTLLAKSNFKIERLENVGIPYFFTGEEELQQFVKGWLPHLNRIPEEKRQEFLHQITRHYLATHGLVEGKILLTFNVLEIEAIRLEFVSLLLEEERVFST